MNNKGMGTLEILLMILAMCMIAAFIVRLIG
jgi:hypothetical protein